MSRIGIMGGTFDPIHIGHLMLAECAREELALEEIWLIPTGCSYQKHARRHPDHGAPTPEERLRMAELAAEQVPYFRSMDIEVRREGYTYSYETLEELNRLYPGHEFFFILGADCLSGIESWKNPERLFAACRVAAAVREDADLNEMEEKVRQLRRDYRADIVFLPFRRLQISSTEIRERVRRGKSIRYMVPECVASYIKEKGFYRDENN